jgi:membrane-associated protease RseP (regulator of RpoE activity)
MLGTMGAFIQIKEPPKNRNILLDIGLAGPLAGLVVAIPVLIYGLLVSEITQLPSESAPGIMLEGNSILYLLMKYLVKGQLLPAPESYNGVQPILYWLGYLFTGLPLPRGGMDVTMDATLFAGWAGLLVTAMNLIPAGQLDGGHSLFALVGDKAARLRPFIIGGLALLGFAWSGWWLWAGLIFFLGNAHLEPLDLITPLSTSRRWLAVLAVILFILVFIPVPMVNL